MKRSEVKKAMYDAFCKPVPYHDDGGIQLIWQIENVLKAAEKFMIPNCFIQSGFEDEPTEVDLILDTIGQDVECKWEEE